MNLPEMKQSVSWRLIPGVMILAAFSLLVLGQTKSPASSKSVVASASRPLRLTK